MAASFSNPRNAASPCERMRGCSFADNFVSDEKTVANLGTDNGTGNVIDHQLTSDGNGFYDFGIVSQPGGFSVVIHFNHNDISTGIVIGNANLISGAIADGFCVWVDRTGVRANHSNGAIAPTVCFIDMDHIDSEWHTVTYVVDMTAGKHYLYVDALAVDEQDTTINEEIGTALDLMVGGDGSSNYTGDLYKPRIFDTVLTAEEHALYAAGTVETFFASPLAAYRCDEFCDDTAGHKIWDRTTALLDLYKADRVTSAKFPTLETDKYFFDAVDDYISNLPDLPANYTISAAVSTPQLFYPAIEQDNDKTFSDLLTTEGEYWGYLHSLVIHSAELTPMQLLHDEYMHLYWLWRGRAFGAYHRLITEETCKLTMFLDAGTDVYTDYSREANTGSGHAVTRNGADGCSFPNADSHVLIPYDVSLNFDEGGTIAFYGDFDYYSGGNTLFDRTGTCQVILSGNTVNFNGFSFPAITFDNNKQLAFTWKIGSKARMFVDGIFHGESSTNIGQTPSVDDAILGNSASLNSPSKHSLKQVYIGNQALADREILALFEEAQNIGATAMETGNRTEVEGLFTAAAVNFDTDPGGAFQLIAIVVDFNIAPTTAENITIGTLRAGQLTTTEHTADPSLSTDLQHVYRFDKRFEAHRTLTVDYTNTDARTVSVMAVFQLDDQLPGR